MQRWESGGIKNVRRDKINWLADAFKPAFLSDGLGRPSSMPFPPICAQFDSKIDMVPVVSTVRGGWNGLPLPCLRWRIDTVYRPPQSAEYVWMQAEGDSMSPDINDGDFVLVIFSPPLKTAITRSPFCPRGRHFKIFLL